MPQLRHPAWSVAVLVSLLLLPLAAAGGDVSVGGVEVTVRDDRTGRCATPLAGFCLFDLEAADAPGDATLDIYQEIRTLTVRVRPDGMPLDGAHLLPDAALVLHAGELYLRHPLLRLATESHARLTAAVPGEEPAGLRMTPRLVELYYEGPGREAATRLPPVGVEYTSGIEYEQIGPYNAPTGGESDAHWRGIPTFACQRGVAEAECRPVLGFAADAVIDLTPNVRGGVQVYDLAVATGDANLHARHDADAQGVAVPLPKRAPAAPAPAPRASTPVPLPEPDPRPASAPLAWSPPREAVAPPATGVTTTSATPPAFSTERILLVASASVAFGLLLAALYSRLARARIFDQKTRMDVYARIEAGPGASVSLLARELGVGRTTVRHHVHVLAQHGLVSTKRQGRETLLFAVAGPHAQPDAALLGRSEARRKVAAAVVAGASTQREIQEATGLSQRLVSYHLDHMRRAGFVHEGAGWPRAYAPTAALRGLLPAPSPQGRVQGATS